MRTMLHTVQLTQGDVRTIRVVHRRDHVRLLIDDQDTGPENRRPLIVAILSDRERQALIRALRHPR
jgi:hypothetical protein